MNSLAGISFDGIYNKSNNTQAECTDKRIKTCSCVFTYAMKRIEKYKPKITRICDICGQG